MELVVEGPAKAHEARKRALYGEWSTNAQDEYQFWRAQSPAWVVPLSWAFRWFGVGWSQLRAVSIGVALLGFLGLLLLAWRRFSIVGVAVVAVCYGLDFYLFHYERAGLLEPAVNAWLVLTVIAGLAGLRRVTWLVVAQVTFLLALMCKQTAVFFTPVFAGIWLVALHRSYVRGSSEGLARRGVVMSALFVIAALAWWVSREDYLRSAAWNVGHIFLPDIDPAEASLWRILVSDPFARTMEPWRLYQQLILLLPVMFPLALLKLVALLHGAIRRRPIAAFDLVVAAWALCAFAALQATPHVRVRFSLILFPPMVLLAAAGARLLVDRFGTTRPRHVSVMAIPLLASFVVNANWFLKWARDRTYDLPECNRHAAILLSHGDVVVGNAAAQLTFDSEADHFYVKPPFNQSPLVLRSLGVTHVLARFGGHEVRRMRWADPRWRARNRLITGFDYHGTVYLLWNAP
jgi:hypothetical protein